MRIDIIVVVLFLLILIGATGSLIYREISFGDKCLKANGQVVSMGNSAVCIPKDTKILIVR